MPRHRVSSRPVLARRRGRRGPQRHVRLPRLAFRLPGVPRRYAGSSCAASRKRTLSTNLDTVIVNTDEQQLILLWRAYALAAGGPHDVTAIESRHRQLSHGTSIRQFNVELYREHLEEASFLYEQRLAYLHDPEVNWPDLGDWEERFEAHIDALVVGGELALEICRRRLSKATPARNTRRCGCSAARVARTTRSPC